MKSLLLAGTGLIALMACSPAADSVAKTGEAAPFAVEAESAAAEAEGPELGSFGIETADMDPAVDPGDDFFRYVNGAWLDSFVIPDEFSNYGAFTVLFERSEERVRRIIEDAAKADAAPGSPRQKIGDYFASFVDIAAIEAAGLMPIEDQLESYAAIKSHDDVASAFADIARDSRRPFSAYVDVDSRAPDSYAVYIGQSGLGLPNRDYYLKPEFADKAEAYKGFLAQMLRIAGVPAAQSEERALAVYALEERLAEAHWAPGKRRNRDLTYNAYSLDELEAYAPGMPWRSMLDKLDLDGPGRVILRENDALAGSAEIFEETPVAVWADYLTAHALSAHAALLPSEVDDAQFAFYGKTLRGVPEQRERWKRGVAAVNGALGEAVGQVYVERHFPASSKAQMEALVANLKTAFKGRLDGLDWMSDETKEEARAKLAAFTTKIGYPDEWTDYSTLEIVAGDPVGNKRRADAFEHRDMVAKLGGPIDEGEWFMTPQTVNAYYSPNRNEIVFPAAILQAPFFDPEADPAVNYGAIGAVIGHEIGHGFDDQGRKSDGTGALRDWWTKEDAARFDERAERLGAQYAGYSPIEGHFVNPELTMGENIGDLGGLTMAYDAYRLSLGGEEAPVLDGFTGDQRFFMAWAQVWKRLYRDDELKNRLATDPHSPSRYRTNGVVRNMDAWYAAFPVTEDDALYLPEDERVRIW